jgi:hypothetical protein
MCNWRLEHFEDDSWESRIGELTRPSLPQTVYAYLDDKAAADPLAAVDAHFDSFEPQPELLAEARDRLERWVGITCLEIRGGGRANDEQVELRASILYTLEQALRGLQATEGKLLVSAGHDWESEVKEVCASRVEVEQALAAHEGAVRLGVWTINRFGGSDEKLWPADRLPYSVWSRSTASLLGEFVSADEAIARAKENPDDLTVYLDEGDAKATLIYDPRGLVRSRHDG